MRPPIYSQNYSAEKTASKKKPPPKKASESGTYHLNIQKHFQQLTTSPSTRNITISLTLAPPWPPFSAPTWGDFDGKPDGAQLAKRPGSCSRSSSSCHWDAGSWCRYRSMCHSPYDFNECVVVVGSCGVFVRVFAIVFGGKQRSVDSKGGLIPEKIRASEKWEFVVFSRDDGPIFAVTFHRTFSIFGKGSFTLRGF